MTVLLTCHLTTVAHLQAAGARQQGWGVQSTLPAHNAKDCPMAFTPDASRLMFPTQRRCNAVWRGVAGEKASSLPQTALALMRQRIDPRFLEAEAERPRADLERARGAHTERQVLYPRRDLWWADELLRDDSPYDLIPMGPEQYACAAHIRARSDPDLLPGIRPEEVPADSRVPAIVPAIANRVSYCGSAEHKTYPSPAEPPALRPDATPCDPDTDCDDMHASLAEGVRRGCVSQRTERGFPRHVWGDIGEAPYEGHHRGHRLNREQA